MQLVVLFGVLAIAFAKPAPNNDPMINEGLFEGDIFGIDPDSDRNAVPHDSRRWPQGVVPYYLAPEVEHFKELIEKAMRHIEAHSCVRFVERRPYDRDYVKIFSDTGCYSQWGRAGGEQRLSLASGCENFAVIVHELMHAIGFEHEHNRSDRDDYLIIYWENIQEQYDYAFRKLQPDQNRLLSQFDFSSIMLYGSLAFSKEPWNDKYTMLRRDGKVIDDIYGRETMSVLDARRINKLYLCPQDSHVI